MRVKDVMTETIAVCTPTTKLREAAQLMDANDCGIIPVVENEENRRLVGVVTDRDIVCRAIAQGRDPVDTTVADCLSMNPWTVAPDVTLDDCGRLMEEHQVRRVPVTDSDGRCCGMVSQADIALNASDQEAARLLRTVSAPTLATRR